MWPHVAGGIEAKGLFNSILQPLAISSANPLPIPICDI